MSLAENAGTPVPENLLPWVWPASEPDEAERSGDSEQARTWINLPAESHWETP
jgi:hypothetical protein